MARKEAMGVVLDWMIVGFKGPGDNDAQVVPIMDVLMATHCTEKIDSRWHRMNAINVFYDIVLLAERTRTSLIDYLYQINLEIMTRESAYPRNFTHVSNEVLLLLREDRFSALMANGTAFPNIKRVNDTLNKWMDAWLRPRMGAVRW